MAVNLQCPICQTRLPALPILGVQRLKCSECGSNQQIELTAKDIEELNASPLPVLQQSGEEIDPRIQVRPPAYALSVLSGLGVGLLFAGLLFQVYYAVIDWRSLSARDEISAIILLLQDCAKPGLCAVAWSIVFFGSRCMMRMTSYRWAFAACVLASIPMLSPFLVVGIPLGIWGIVILYRPQVREAFNANQPGI